MSRLILGGGVAVGMLVLVFLAAKLLTMMFRRRKPDEKAAVAPPAKGAGYRFEDFLEDLKNPAVTIDAIIQKCGGMIPREWEERIGPADPKAPGGAVQPRD